MKVLGIMASPTKKGNSDILLQQALNGAKTKGAEIEKVNLVDEKLPPCIGCFACKKHRRLCVPTPEINTLLEKIQDADALIFSTPVWWFNMSSYLKLLLDHFVAFFKEDNTSLISGKRVAVLTCSGGGHDAGTKETIMILKKSFDFLGLQWVGELRVVNTSKHGVVKEDQEALSKAYAIGEKICL